MNRRQHFSEEEKSAIVAKVHELGKRSRWYHKIDLGGGIVTPGYDFENVWNPIRRVMDSLDYQGKLVLDLASWDGMWAFEAEERGARQVVATDTRLQGYENLLYCRSLLDSNVIPLCNVPVQHLDERLNIVGLEKRFDIVHHLGLLYHLRDPLLSFSQVRKVISDDGLLLLETAFINDDKHSSMLFSGLPGNHHFYGISDTWAPTLLALKEMLIRSYFMPVMEEVWIKTEPSAAAKEKYRYEVGRITMLAKPIAITEGNEWDWRKVFGSQ